MNYDQLFIKLMIPIMVSVAVSKQGKIDLAFEFVKRVLKITMIIT